MSWTSPDLQASFYSQTIYNVVLGICKKSVLKYQTSINPPRIMLRNIIYKTSFCCVSLMKKSKGNVSNVFNFIKKDTTTTCVVSSVIIEHASINVFSDETVIFFLHEFLPEFSG